MSTSSFVPRLFSLLRKVIITRREKASDHRQDDSSHRVLCETLEPRLMLSAGAVDPGTTDPPPPPPFVVGDYVSDQELFQVAPDAKGNVVFSDADRDQVTVSLSGNGTLEVYRTVESGDADAYLILLSDTDMSSKVMVKTKGAGHASTTVHDIYGLTGSVREIMGTKNVDLTGEISLAEKLKSLKLRNLQAGSRITLNRDGGSVGSSDNIMFHVSSVVAASVNTKGMPIKQIMADSWQGSMTTVQPRIVAPWIGRMLIKGAKGNKGRAKNGTSGNAGKFEADLILDGTNAPGGVALGNVLIKGNLGTADVANSWQIFGSLGMLNVEGTVNDTSILATGEIQKIMIGATRGSDFFAGVSDVFMTDVVRVPDSTDDFAAGTATTAGINSIMIRGFKGAKGAKGSKKSKGAKGAKISSSVLLEDSHFGGATLGVVKLMNFASEDTYSLTVLGDPANLQQVIYMDTADRQAGWVWSPGDEKPDSLLNDVPLNVVVEVVV